MLQADEVLQQLAGMQLQDPGPSSGPPPWGPAVQPSLQPQAWQMFRYNAPILTADPSLSEHKHWAVVMLFGGQKQVGSKYTVPLSPWHVAL